MSGKPVNSKQNLGGQGASQPLPSVRKTGRLLLLVGALFNSGSCFSDDKSKCPKPSLPSSEMEFHEFDIPLPFGGEIRSWQVTDSSRKQPVCGCEEVTFFPGLEYLIPNCYNKKTEAFDGFKR